MNSFGKFFWGLLLLVVGIIWLAFTFGWLEDLNFLKHTWPLLILIPCVLRLLFSSNDRCLSIMGIAVGLIWQIHYWLPDSIDLKMARMSMFPVILICVALHMLIGRKRTHSHHH